MVHYLDTPFSDLLRMLLRIWPIKGSAQCSMREAVSGDTQHDAVTLVFGAGERTIVPY